MTTYDPEKKTLTSSANASVGTTTITVNHSWTIGSATPWGDTSLPSNVLSSITTVTHSFDIVTTEMWESTKLFLEVTPNDPSTTDVQVPMTFGPT